MVLWVEGLPFVDLCGIFWTKLCDSRCIQKMLSKITYLFKISQHPPTFSHLWRSGLSAGSTHAHPPPPPPLQNPGYGPVYASARTAGEQSPVDQFVMLDVSTLDSGSNS